MKERDEFGSDADANWKASSTMECDECGSDTGVNWGDNDYVLCRTCFDEVKNKSKRSNYKPDDGVSKLVSFVGWVIVAISLIMIPASLASLGLVGNLASSFGLLTGGLLLVVAGHATRALLNNANYTRQILELMKKDK
jgi:hypothetical protein